MRLKFLSRRFSVPKYRLILSLSIIAGILVVTATTTLAWFSGVITNSDNKITTANVSLNLMTLDHATDVTPLNISEHQPLPMPSTTGELFFNGNTLISLNDNAVEPRKFFEYNGKSPIEGVQPNFRQQRPLIVQNSSSSPMSYTLEFLTREIDNPGLSTAFFFHYTRIGDDIPNTAMTANSTTTLGKGNTVENLGINIKKIGGDVPITIMGNSTHIYMVDMGISQTAGNSYQGAGLILDIVLSTTFASHTVRPITDQASFVNAISLNKGGDTFVLTRDLNINQAIVSDNVFNLDLNGYTLTFDTGAKLTVNYPNAVATMDIGSNHGGRIVNQTAMHFIGVKDRSVLNWYTDITGIDFPTNATNVVINLKTVSLGNDTSSDNDETSSDAPTGYQDYAKIIVPEEFEFGNGTKSSPYIVETPEQFKLMVEQSSSSDWFKVTKSIANITNVPDKIHRINSIIIFIEGIKFSNINVVGTIADPKTLNIFKNCSVYYYNDGSMIYQYNLWFEKISYNGVMVD